MNLIGTKTLETERLILRKTFPEDLEPMYKNWANDRRVTRFLTWKPYDSIEELRKTYHRYMLDNADNPEFFDWKIVLKSINEPIGAIGVVSKRDDIEEAMIGYCLGVEWWHKGIMTEAFTEVIRFLFEEADFNRIAAQHDVNNPHSGDVMKKCGLIYEGTLRQAGKNNQGICDLSQYAILKEDYFKKKNDAHKRDA